MRLSALPLLLLSAFPSIASSLTWTGGGGDKLWSNPKNWKEEAIPADGDALIFPAGIAQQTGENDLSGLQVESLRLEAAGYTMGGLEVSIVSGITTAFSGTGAVQLEMPVTVQTAQTWNLAAGNVLALMAPVVLRDTLTVAPMSSGFVRVDGEVSGSGAMTKAGSGTLFLNGANTFTGACSVQEGTVTLGHPGALGSSAAGTVLGANTLLRVAGNMVIPEPLILGAGALIENQAGEPVLSGPILLQGAGGFRAFTGRLVFSGVISGPGALTSTGQTRLTGTAANTWAGTTTVVAGTMQLGKTPGVNAVPGNVSATVNGRVELLASHQIPDTATVSLSGTARLIVPAATAETLGGLTMQAGLVDNAGSLTVDGDVSITADPTPSVAGGSIRPANSGNPAAGRAWMVNSGAVLQVTGPLSGDTLRKQGAGELRCTGDGSTATLRLEGGTALWQGDSPGSSIVLQGGVLRGTGRTGAVSQAPDAAGTRLEPGTGVGAFRTENLSGNLALTLALELNGTVRGTEYDSLDVTGTAVFGLPRLAVTVGYPAVVGDTFVILNKTSPGPVTGQFISSTVPLGEGAYLAAAGGHYFRISYSGGDGNDVILTKVVPPPANITEFGAAMGTGSLQGFSTIHLAATGGAGLNYRIEGSSDLTNWALLTTFPADAAGRIAADFTHPAHTAFFYRLALP